MDLIDVRGLSCPEPVIMVKEALSSGEDSYTVLSDSNVSCENITRFAEHQGYKVSLENKGADFQLTISR